MGGKMADFLVTCSLAVYLIALLYGAYRILVSRATGRSVIREHYRKFSLFSRRAQHVHPTPDLSYYV
jgi:hypothetical protein